MLSQYANAKMVLIYSVNEWEKTIQQGRQVTWRMSDTNLQFEYDWKDYRQFDLHRGIPFVWTGNKTQERLDRIRKEFTYRDDDVFITTYPKSGTTLTQEILYLLKHGGQRPEGKFAIEECPWLEAVCLKEEYDLQTKFKFPTTQAQFEDMSRPRIIKSHTLYLHHPGVMDDGTLSIKSKIVYVARNPKDTCVSYFHFMKNRQTIFDYHGEWDAFVERFMDGFLGEGCWFDHVCGWFEKSKQHPDQILFIKYEDLVLNPVEEITRIVNFLKWPNCSAEVIEKVAKLSSFETMKEYNEKAVSKNFFRKGKIGDWQEHFSPSQLEKFETLCKEQLSKHPGLAFMDQYPTEGGATVHKL